MSQNRILDAEECPKCGGTDATPRVFRGEFVRRDGGKSDDWTCDSEWHGVKALRAALATAEAEREALRTRAIEAEYVLARSEARVTALTAERDAALTELRGTRDALMASRSDWMDRHARMKERAEAAEARAAALTEALREWLDAAEALATCNRAEFIDAQIRVTAARLAARALLVGEPE